jgi:hypothetical protein
MPQADSGSTAPGPFPFLFPATTLRAPSPSATCSCRHGVYCDCACHNRDCDPAATVCDLDFLPDDGGLTPWGCPACTPGDGLPHVLGCELIGWSVPLGLP